MLGGMAAAGALGTASALSAVATLAPAATGRLKQSVCRWPFRSFPLPELCRGAKAVGLAAIDLLHADEWSVVRDCGLSVSMGYPSRRETLIETGFNDPVNHAMLLKELEVAIPLAARAHVPNLIAMFGKRNPLINRSAAIDNCIAGLARIAPLATASGVTICVELLNSKVDHPGYEGDHTAFGAAVMQGVSSPHVKLLYDIYHMRDNMQWIGHFHTGGVPGRHEIDATQELNYRAIARAIADVGFRGYLAHEFVPTRADPFASLAEAVGICSV